MVFVYCYTSSSFMPVVAIAIPVRLQNLSLSFPVLALNFERFFGILNSSSNENWLPLKALIITEIAFDRKEAPEIAKRSFFIWVGEGNQAFDDLHATSAASVPAVLMSRGRPLVAVANRFKKGQFAQNRPDKSSFLRAILLCRINDADW